MSNENPLDIFTKWYGQAKANPDVKDHTEMSLATADEQGRPSNRIVLLKGYDERGFVFYTNYNGRKSEQIKQNSYAAICFYWPPLEKQIRIEGKAEKVSTKESDEYFASRPLESRLGAWASKQSQYLENREKFLQEIEQYRQKFQDGKIKRPDHWGGWRIIPNCMEFWQAGEFRIHHREVFEKISKNSEDKNNNKWKKSLLYP